MSKTDEEKPTPSPRSREEIEAALAAVLTKKVTGPAEHLRIIQDVLQEAVFTRQRRGE